MKSLKYILVAALAAASLPSMACYSEGSTVGTVQSISYRGFMLKSWEGKLVVDGESFSGNQRKMRGGNVWNFSTQSRLVADVLNQAMSTGKRVKVDYCQVVISIATSTRYRVTDVSILDQ